MKTALPLLISCLLFYSCNEPANFEGAEREVALMAPPMMRRAHPAPMERMLIRTGSINFKTENIDKTRKEIEKLCRDFNAYVSREQQEKFDGQLQFEQVIRVPAPKFDLMVKAIEGLGGNIDARSFESRDVTEEFFDTEAHIRTKKELENRYLQLLSKAKNVTEMLAIETQLSNVRGEIEGMQGRINLLSNQVAHSTLTITYYEETVTDNSFASQLGTSFISGWRALLAFLIAIASMWPAVILLGVGVWAVKRWTNRINFRFQSKV